MTSSLTTASGMIVHMDHDGPSGGLPLKGRFAELVAIEAARLLDAGAVVESLDLRAVIEILAVRGPGHEGMAQKTARNWKAKLDRLSVEQRRAQLEHIVATNRTNALVRSTLVSIARTSPTEGPVNSYAGIEGIEDAEAAYLARLHSGVMRMALEFGTVHHDVLRLEFSAIEASLRAAGWTDEAERVANSSSMLQGSASSLMTAPETDLNLARLHLAGSPDQGAVDHPDRTNWVLHYRQVTRGLCAVAKEPYAEARAAATSAASRTQLIPGDVPPFDADRWFPSDDIQTGLSFAAGHAAILERAIAAIELQQAPWFRRVDKPVDRLALRDLERAARELLRAVARADPPESSDASVAWSTEDLDALKLRWIAIETTPAKRREALAELVASGLDANRIAEVLATLPTSAVRSLTGELDGEGMVSEVLVLRGRYAAEFEDPEKAAEFRDLRWLVMRQRGLHPDGPGPETVATPVVRELNAKARSLNQRLSEFTAELRALPPHSRLTVAARQELLSALVVLDDWHEEWRNDQTKASPPGSVAD